MRRKTKKNKIIGTKERPRLVVSRSNKNIFAQIIDDLSGKTLVGISTLSLKAKGTKTQAAFALGEEIARMALKKKIKKVSFDRNNYRYLGRIKALAEGARKGGLDF
jgi:large subunit ribosomal protein L18